MKVMVVVVIILLVVLVNCFIFMILSFTLLRITVITSLILFHYIKEVCH